MKAKFSDYLSGIKVGLQQMIGILRKEYDYVSVLATDSHGFAARISQRSRSVGGKTMTGSSKEVWRGKKPMKLTASW